MNQRPSLGMRAQYWNEPLRKHAYSNTVDTRYLSETLRDIRTSKYQSCRSEENNKSNNHINQMNM